MHKDDFDFQFVSGGMQKVQPFPQIKDVLGENFRAVYQRVSEVSGAKFTEKYLGGLVENENYEINSVRPATALCVFRSYPESKSKELEFIIKMQTNMYQDGLNPSDDEYYRTAAENFGINADEFLEKMKDEKFREQAQKDFNYAALQATSFPQLFFQTSETEYDLLTIGYINLETIESRLQAASSESNT